MKVSLITGSLVFLLALGRSLVDGVGFVDESWFLQMVSRVRSGEVLYRDVFLGVTPLSAYVTLGLTLATGVEIVAVKIVTNGCFAVTTVLSALLARQAGLSAGASLAVMAAMFVWARPYNNPPYTAMAMMFFVAAAAASLSRREQAGGSGARPWVAAGLLAGFAFVSKQNIGILALAGVWIVIGGRSWPEWRQAAGAAGWSIAGAAVATIVVVAPVWASGGLPGLWDFGFAAKGTYLEVGAVPYSRGLASLATALADPFSSFSLATLLHGVVILLPVVVAGVASVLAARLTRLDWIVVGLAFAATLGAYPRLDRFHMAHAVPLHLIALGRLLPMLGPAFARRGLRVASSTALVAILVVVLAHPVVVVARGERAPIGLSHFRGALAPRSDAVERARGAAALADAAGGRPVFLLTPEAGFWYLASGVRNPTPFDIPGRTAFGSYGIPWLVGELERATITQVCLVDRTPGWRGIDEVDAYVRATFEAGPEIGPCRMFRAGPERRTIGAR